MTAAGALTELAVVLDLRSDAAQALMLIGELRGKTRWDERQLLARLSCDLESWQVNSSTSDRLADSIEFLRLVLDLVKLVDVTDDRRAVLIGICELSAGIGGPLNERTPALETALGVSYNGLPARDLIAMGEIAEAMRQAALMLPEGAIHEQAVAADRLLGGMSELGGHISRDRLALLAEADAPSKLGVRVHGQMIEHVQDCSTCERLARAVVPRLFAGKSIGTSRAA